MTRDFRSTSTDSLDDEAIGRLVRETAETWAMPPVRLDAPSWRARVRGSGARRVATARGWLDRLGRAATTAVALTVVGALVAVVLTRPSQTPGSTGGPSNGATPDPSGAAGTAMPMLLVNGDLPHPSAVIVSTEDHGFSRVDLATGKIATTVGEASFESSVRMLGDGSSLCVCVERSDFVAGLPTTLAVSLLRIAADGTLGASTPIETFVGAPDPRDTATNDAPQNVDINVAYSADGRYAFVGWSLRATPIWKSGVLTLDLADGSVTSRLDLPDSSAGDAAARRLVLGPKVVGVGPSGDELVARSWVEWPQPRYQDAAGTGGNEVFRAAFAAGTWSSLDPQPFTTNCASSVARGGPLADGGAWLACVHEGSARVTIRRFGPDGAVDGDLSVAGLPDSEGDPTALSPDGRWLFAWDPTFGNLSRIDLDTGTTIQGHGATASLDDAPLSAIGKWLAPVVTAKSFLRGAIAMSPDGSRIYAIGLMPGTDARETSGSSGVYVFDAQSLDLVSRWQPTADFVSIATSADGSFVYAIGLPGVDAEGRRQLSQGASITVFDATNGSVRLIAGELGQVFLAFPSATLP